MSAGEKGVGPIANVCNVDIKKRSAPQIEIEGRQFGCEPISEYEEMLRSKASLDETLPGYGPYDPDRRIRRKRGEMMDLILRKRYDPKGFQRMYAKTTKSGNIPSVAQELRMLRNPSRSVVPTTTCRPNELDGAYEACSAEDGRTHSPYRGSKASDISPEDRTKPQNATESISMTETIASAITMNSGINRLYEIITGEKLPNEFHEPGELPEGTATG